MIRLFHRHRSNEADDPQPAEPMPAPESAGTDGKQPADAAAAPEKGEGEGDEKQMDAVVERFVNDEDEDEFGEVSFKSFLGAELLASRFFQRQVIFILFVAVLLLIYTGNRYSSQQEIIIIDSLKVQLQKERYNVLTQSSELLNLSRQSNIERALRANGDSAIVNPTTPPYEITVDK